MKRDARIGLAVVLVVGLAITLLVARSIHQHGAQAGIDQDPEPQRETVSANDALPADTGATLDPVYDAHAQAVMEFQTQHDYRPTPTNETLGNNPPGVLVDVGSGPGGVTQNGTNRNQALIAGNGPGSGNGAGVLPPLGQPPIGIGLVTPQPPAVNSLGTYTIAAGDNPWKISAKVFGDGKYAQKIMDANTGLNPSKLKVGQKINIPAIPNATPRIALENTANNTTNQLIPVVGGQGMQQEVISGAGLVPPIGAPPVAAQTHTVAAGDTLGKIAAKYLGSSGPKAVKKLTDANPGLDARKLKIGQELKIPTP